MTPRALILAISAAVLAKLVEQLINDQAGVTVTP